MSILTDKLYFNFDIEPMPQLRPRASSRGGHIRVYDPPKVKKFKQQLAKLARDQYDAEPLEGPLSVTFTFFRPVQKSLSKVEREKRVTNRVQPTVKPDVSNYVKATEDALNGILWKDDAQIVLETSAKLYSDDPKIVVTVHRFPRNDNNSDRMVRIDEHTKRYIINDHIVVDNG